MRRLLFRVLGIACLLLWSRTGAAQATAAQASPFEAEIRAFEKLGSYRGDAPFGLWLKRLLVNTTIDRLRSERRWVGNADDLDELSDTQTSQSSRLEALGLLARLPERARTVVWLPITASPLAARRQRPSPPRH